jgi:2-isopropylmalate synthase
VQAHADDTGKELSSADIYKAFDETYLSLTQPYKFVDHTTVPDTHASEVRRLTATLKRDGEDIEVAANGNGPIDAFVKAMSREVGFDIKIVDYQERAIGEGSTVEAIAFVEAEAPGDNGVGKPLFGVAKHSNIVQASLMAVVCAVNRMVAQRNGPRDAG